MKRVENKHRFVNNLLSILVVGVGVYLIFLPLWPNITLWLDGLGDSTSGVRYSGVLAQENNVESSNLEEAPTEEWLVIPDIHIDERIYVGSDPSLVHQGVWHRPNTSTPDKGGNTVLVGHRFSYNNLATFYHLDKMEVGDTFAIWWDGVEYVYEVFHTRVVEATAVEIEDDTERPIATLYTCTPVWTAEDRLVIRANLVNTEVLDEAN